MDLLLQRRVDLEGDVPERRGGQLWVEQILVGLVGELEEGQRAAVAEGEERVAVHPLGAEQLVGLGPGRDER